MPSRPRAAAAVLAAAAISSCGGGAGDLIAFEVAGGPVQGKRTVVVSDDGRARCNGRPLEPIPSDRLIDAREVERDLGELAERNARYEFPRARGRRYVVRTRDGTVRWSEGVSRPAVLPKAALLELQLERIVCR